MYRMASTVALLVGGAVLGWIIFPIIVVSGLRWSGFSAAEPVAGSFSICRRSNIGP